MAVCVCVCVCWGWRGVNTGGFFPGLFHSTTFEVLQHSNHRWASPVGASFDELDLILEPLRRRKGQTESYVNSLCSQAVEFSLPMFATVMGAVMGKLFFVMLCKWDMWRVSGAQSAVTKSSTLAFSHELKIACETLHSENFHGVWLFFFNFFIKTLDWLKLQSPLNCWNK